MPASARELVAVVLALQVGAEKDIPPTDTWLKQEVERLRAYAKSRGQTLRQIVWEHDEAKGRDR